MSFQSLVVYLDKNSIIADKYTGEKLNKRCRTDYDPDAEPVAVANALASMMTDDIMPQIIVCPGGLLKPLRPGAYLIDGMVLDDAKKEVCGHNDYNYLLLVCSELGKLMSAHAVMIDPASSDDLQPADRITSMPDVHKESRYHACEHNALLKDACSAINKRHENMYTIAVWLDNVTSVGAHRGGSCIEVNDAFGGEGPMGFCSSGDVPVAPLARVYFEQGLSADELWQKMSTESGLLGYTGIDNPADLDKAINNGNEDAKTAASALVYQTAKWIGICALALHGDVDLIVVGGKGASSSYLRRELEKKVKAIAPVYFFEKTDISKYLAEKACLVNEKAMPILKY